MIILLSFYQWTWNIEKPCVQTSTISALKISEMRNYEIQDHQQTADSPLAIRDTKNNLLSVTKNLIQHIELKNIEIPQVKIPSITLSKGLESEAFYQAGGSSSSNIVKTIGNAFATGNTKTEEQRRHFDQPHAQSVTPSSMLIFKTLHHLNKMPEKKRLLTSEATSNFKLKPAKSETVSLSNRSIVMHQAIPKTETKTNFQSKLALYATRYAVDKKIIISVIDSAYIEMALNFWESSLVKFGIINYLFICLNEKAKSLLPREANECLVIEKHTNAENYTQFGTAQFNQKVMIKTEISLRLLEMGYSVIISDADIFFLKNPMSYFTCIDCDLIVQDNTQNNSEANSGFYMVKPTKGAMELQRRSIQESNVANKNDQNMMNMLIRRMNKMGTIKVVFLDNAKFLPGNVFFNPNDFMIDYDCSNCVMVHNNWVIGLRTKIYRFKEMGMWVVDTDGYYSSTTNRYIMYHNPWWARFPQEKAAIELALNIAHALNRILILPQFNCPKRKSKRCSIQRALGRQYLLSLDELTYRESVFLKHPKVPTSTKQSLSPEIDLTRFVGITNLLPNLADVIKALTANQTLMSYKIIQFKSLFS